MGRRTFMTVVIVILAAVIGLTVVLLVVQARHSRLIEEETHAVTAVETTYEASLLLDRQREALAASPYLPLDQSMFRTWGADFQQLMQQPGLTNSPEDVQQIQRIRGQEEQFFNAALALPPTPSPLQLQVVRNLAESVEDRLQEYRTTHSIDLSGLFTTEREERDLNIATLLLANGLILILILAGLIFLTRLTRLQAEALTLRATDQLRSDFVSFAAHELRNPASAIKTAAAMLREPSLEPEIREQVVESINRSADALTRLVLNLLNIGRVEAGELRLNRAPISLPHLINDLIAELEMYHPGIEKRVQRDLPDIMVDIDEEYIKLAVSNILDNAIKYSAPGSPFYITGEVADTQVIVHVRDIGVGIPPDVLPHIFDKYETSGAAPHSLRRGVGLGLYMTRLLIEAHGGTIWAESELGRGAAISFSLPRAKEPLPK